MATYSAVSGAWRGVGGLLGGAARAASVALDQRLERGGELGGEHHAGAFLRQLAEQGLERRRVGGSEDGIEPGEDDAAHALGLERGALEQRDQLGRRAGDDVRRR